MKTAKEYNLTIKNKKLFLPNGKKEVERLALWEYLISLGEKAEDAPIIGVRLMDEALNTEPIKQIKEQEGFKHRDYVHLRKEIFENCVYKNLRTRKQSVDKTFGYIKHPTGWIPLGVINRLSYREFKDAFSQKYKAELDILKDEINDLTSELNGPVYTHYNIAEQYMEDTQILAEEYYDPFLEKESPHNLLLEGDPKPALAYMPFKQDTKPELNPYLKEFLDKMSDHEYFCAYLYCNWLGILVEQVLYIQGEGGDGKSSFLGMLEDISMKTLGTYSEGSNAMYDMKDCSIITLAESVEKHLLQKSEIKALTGRDPVSMNGKYRDAYSGKVKGLFIVHANCNPLIVGQEAEIRRLRLFFMDAKKKKTKTIDPEEYRSLLAENRMGFVAYCRQCYETLKTSEKLVKDPPSMDIYHKQLRDANKATLYDILFEKLAQKNIVLNSSLSMTEKELRSIVYKITIKAEDANLRMKGFIDGFLNSLKNDKDCVFDGFGNISGLGKDIENPIESTGHTKFVKKPS